MMQVQIALATYNGAAHIEAQLTSLMVQSYPHWQIIARDDGSLDATPALLHAFAQRYPDRIRILSSATQPLGPAGNFSLLMEAATAPYIMPCDQDDVWHPDKIARSVEAMAALERKHGAATPLLVHGDSRVVDEGLKVLHPSFHALYARKPARARFASALVHNAAQGCTVTVNRALIRLACPVPPEARMHDMWLFLIALGAGRVEFIDAQLVDYRQHGANAVGMRAPRRQDVRRAFAENIRQAEALKGRIGHLLPQKERRVLEDFLALPGQGALQRRAVFLKNRYFRPRFYENIAAFLFM